MSEIYPDDVDLTALSMGPTKRKYMNQLKVASTACFHSKDLRPWMRTYAEWLALQPGRPSRTERIKVANKLAHDKVSRKALLHLENRVDFQTYHDKFAAGAVTTARAMLEAQAPWYVEQHRLGLEKTIKAQDFKAIPNFTGPVIERVWPRREGPTTPTQITINISSRQQADLAQTAPPVLDAEIVEEPKALPP